MRTYTGNLDDLGINILTGEACGLSMRLLCDVNKDGQELITSFLCDVNPTGQDLIKNFLNIEIKFGRYINNPDCGSIMLTGATCRDLWVFHARMNGQWVLETAERYTTLTALSVDEYEVFRNGKDITRRWPPFINRNGVSVPDGRNIHQMSGCALG
jgi:hypothetical protein